MSIEDGSYRIFNGGNEKYALAFYDSDTVKLNITGNVRVEIKSQSGGQMIRFNDSRVNPRTSNWFGYNTNLKPDKRVIQRTEKHGLMGENLLWAITSAGSGLYTIKVWNADAAWTLPSDPRNPSDIYLEPAQGLKGQLWKIEKA
ncbi:hypothetical protein RSOLAG1IB_10310 [Rhizoctonia solani AG-1 IB]|uniref:Ricin B lectin domain-containing protein n=2 Tax=Rhizoctonia solani TaxID=456999 RepID=M5BWV5_THACB|nr:unnamed protein product [Rhizoctonia solani]CCO32103.1 hypothetical protein BN14_06156 [Rhizoctonia solani AG-1 IB]CEL62236.1 hypothetical protein RSOLAG1IB_10310 [Rhizoctonia solani AG-1 IB]